MIIAIAGKMGTGKTTLAKMLGLPVYSFGNPLKRECSETYGIPIELFYSQEGKRKLFNIHGTYMTLRRLLQWHGTDYRRAQNSNYWIEKFDLSRRHESFVIDDVRFKEELSYCKSIGAVTVRLEPYEGWNFYSDHSSEIALDNEEFDYVVYPTFGGLKFEANRLSSAV